MGVIDRYCVWSEVEMTYPQRVAAGDHLAQPTRVAVW